MHFFYTLKRQDQTTFLIKQFAAFVLQLFQHPVLVLCINIVSSIGCTLHDWVKSQGIALKFSAPCALLQNSSAGRSVQLLATNAGAIQLCYSLPQQLLPKAMRAARYPSSNFPNSSLGLASPIDLLFLGRQSPSSRSIPKLYMSLWLPDTCPHPRGEVVEKEELRKRALNGYVIDYDSTNIF
jgi:hypothetical protein